MPTTARLLLFTAVAFAAAACTSTAGTSTATSPASAPTSPIEATATPQSSPAAQDSAPAQVEGAVLRFTSATASVDVTIGADNLATRTFLASLPLTLEVEEFSGREKIAYLPTRLPTAGVPGSKPEDGDLIYFAPWGNLGFYYDTSGLGFDDRVIHLGAYAASMSELTALEGAEVRLELVNPPATDS